MNVRQVRVGQRQRSGVSIMLSGVKMCRSLGRVPWTGVIGWDASGLCVTGVRLSVHSLLEMHLGWKVVRYRGLV